MAHTYILKTAKKSYYVGSADDIDERLRQHKSGRVKSTRDKLPIILVFKEYHSTKAEAQKKEYKIKNWKSGKMIELLIKQGPINDTKNLT